MAEDYNSFLELTIEKLIYGGDGLARLPADDKGRSKAVFVPFVLQGEHVDAVGTEEKPAFVRARADRILQASSQRVKPECPYFGDCGGCHYQHTGYEHQLEIKTSILIESLQRIAKLELPTPPRVHASEPWNYRNRTRMKVNSGTEFAVGYYRYGSHSLMPVEVCPISSPLINRAIAALWEIGRLGNVIEEIEEIEFFANHDDTLMMVELTVLDERWNRRKKPGVLDFVVEFRRSVPEVAGISVFRNLPDGRQVRDEIPEDFKQVFGAEQLTYKVTSFRYQVSAGSFFQTNRYLTEVLMSAVTSGRSGGRALDLYAGGGLFAVPLSNTFDQVAAVEAASFSCHDLKRNSPRNATVHHRTTEQFLETLGTDEAFDYVVVDPPRAGLGEKTAEMLAKLAAPRIAYVSCDPATLSRDLKVLVTSGYRIEQAHLIDLFPQTFHIESVFQLVR